uniref:Cytochrome c oxidase assembly homolog 18 n=1 Tax=Nothobranchius furzeri TaxID=105023 RepID=A0A1A8B098_NOTFU
MLCVGGLVRSRVLYFSGQGLLRLTEPVVASTTDTRTRSVSGVGGTNWAGGWYGSLSDSAPVHLCENFLVGFQQASGLPWWLSIVMATASVRTTITLPLAAYQILIISKVELLQAEISELAKRLAYEVSVRSRERGWTDKQERVQFKRNLRRIVSQLYIRDNCHPFKASLLVWVQLPLWVSFSLALRNLSLNQSALQGELAAGGALWFHDLTVPDSTWILPVLLGITNLLIIEVSLVSITWVVHEVHVGGGLLTSKLDEIQGNVGFQKDETKCCTKAVREDWFSERHLSTNPLISGFRIPLQLGLNTDNMN